jgi:hypothetical protein
MQRLRFQIGPADHGLADHGLADHVVPAMYRSRAAARLRRTVGEAPTTRVLRRISFMIRSSGLLVRLSWA